VRERGPDQVKTGFPAPNKSDGTAMSVLGLFGLLRPLSNLGQAQDTLLEAHSSSPSPARVVQVSLAWRMVMKPDSNVAPLTGAGAAMRSPSAS
jgi:hypothetical protein